MNSYKNTFWNVYIHVYLYTEHLQRHVIYIYSTVYIRMCCKYMNINIYLCTFIWSTLQAAPETPGTPETPKNRRRDRALRNNAKNPTTQPLESYADVPQVIFYIFSGILSVVLVSCSFRFSQLIHLFYCEIYPITISGYFCYFLTFIIEKFNCSFYRKKKMRVIKMTKYFSLSAAAISPLKGLVRTFYHALKLLYILIWGIIWTSPNDL